MNQPRPQPDTATSRVLIVDDDADFLASISDLLETEGGFSVDTAADSESALRSARELPPDIALLDVNLGATSGLDRIPRLKASLPGVPCIVITAYRDVESAVKAVRLGADDYLHKPIEPTALVRILERHLERRRWAAERVEHERRFQAVFDQAFQMALPARRRRQGPRGQ